MPSLNDRMFNISKRQDIRREPDSSSNKDILLYYNYKVFDYKKKVYKNDLLILRLFSHFFSIYFLLFYLSIFFWSTFLFHYFLSHISFTQKFSILPKF